MRVLYAAMAALLVVCSAGAQMTPANRVTTRTWKAFWVAVPGSPAQDYGVYHFRRSFDLSSVPPKFEILVSADNRYQLFVNGERASSGPARGDLTHWRYETVDIARYLKAGRNVLAAVVWNDGPERAVAQITNRTGFLLQAADSADEDLVDTNKNWKCVTDRAYAPRLLQSGERTGYYALGPNEHVDARAYPWGWEQPAFDDSQWQQAEEMSHGASRDSRDAPNRWMLVANALPPQDEHAEPALKLRTPAALTVPAHTEATFLFDREYLTTAYPELAVSGGTGATVEMRYAESPYVSRHPITKPNRNDVEGNKFYGPSDEYILDGQHRTFRPLYWRTFRYVQLHVRAEDEPVTIEALRDTFSGYPFQRRASFDAGSAELQKIVDTGWRTARLCAHETYMDCPFYEQLQYAGDARIQMFISLYMTGDARLMRNGIALIDSSRTAEGATYSRAPSNLQQYIPPFSLWWVGMVHDYSMYVDDPDFVRSMMPGVHAVLEFFNGYQKANGSLGRLPWWNFVDWVHAWPNGESPSDPDGSSTALDLQLLLAYQWASNLEQQLGDVQRADVYKHKADQLSATIRQLDWDAGRGLFADEPQHRSFSQHVNALAVLAHLADGEQAHDIVQKIISDASLTQASIYFRAYTNAALREAGFGDRYVEMLGPWRAMLAEGLTTWSEWNGPDTRSDCHAWGASPNFELLRTVAGIESAAPGFKRVRIAPNLGALDHVDATMPHPKGMIHVQLQKNGTGSIELPADTSGTLLWRGKTVQLHPGKNQISE